MHRRPDDRRVGTPAGQETERSGVSTRITIKDVAVYAHTSISTVSLALRDRPGISAETRQLVQDAASQLGYVPDRRASHLRRSDVTVIGVVYDTDKLFQVSLLDSLYGSAAMHGCELTLAGATPNHGPEECVSELLGNRCLGLIFMTARIDNDTIAHTAGQLPSMCLCRNVENPAVGVVISDDLQGQRLAVGHLAALGHTRICYVDGNEGSVSRPRLNGYLRAMAESGLGEYSCVVKAGGTSSHGIQAAEQVLAMRPMPSAVVCWNDACAAAVVQHLRSRSLHVPGDISVVGYDDAPIASDPTLMLTTVRQNRTGLSERTIEMLLSRIHRDRAPGDGTLVVGNELVTRGTTAALHLP